MWSAAAGEAISSAGETPTGRCARREVRTGRSVAADTTLLAGAAEAAEVCGAAAGAESAGADAAGVESALAGAPPWRPLIAVTRSPLRILAVPVKPRLAARPCSSASFMVLRLPLRLTVSSAPVLGTPAR